MTPSGARSALPYLVQPWRYASEGARDWVAAGFTVYGVAAPEPRQRRLGGKGRSGRVPDGLPRLLPSRAWMRLTSFGLLVEGDGWEVSISSAAHAQQIPARHHAMVAAHHVDPEFPDDHVAGAASWTAELLVDGEAIEFQGSQAGEHWSGDGVVRGTGVTISGRGIEPSRLVLERVNDPGPYLEGERRYLAGR